VNPIATQLANGRRLASRALIMRALAAFDVEVYRKSLIATPEEAVRHDDTWGGIGATTEQDDHAYEYTRIGPAKLMIDRFNGGAMLDNRDLVSGDDVVTTAVIEPYDEEAEVDDRAIVIPEWEPKEGDMVALIVDVKLIIYMEVVGVTGQTMMSDNGKRYLLNKRDDLTYMEPFATEFEDR
jgi:hypothetical protein